MSDQGKWFKLHVSVLIDSKLENLSMEDFGRWAKFGAYLKQDGTDGIVTFEYPAFGLQKILRVGSYDEVLKTLRKFPNCVVNEEGNKTSDGVTITTVTWTNWLRYQGDFSGDRVRKFRANVTGKRRREEKRREERRRDEKKTPPLTPPAGGNGVVVETPEKLTDVQRVILAFKVHTGHDLHDKSWDVAFFRRFARPAKELLDYLGSWRESADCIEWVSERMKSKNLSFTLETIVKHMADYKLEVMGRRQ